MSAAAKPQPDEALYARLRQRMVEIQSAARILAGFPNYGTWEPGKPGVGEGKVETVGHVKIVCVKELVQRARGPKVRHRYKFQLDGAPIREKALWSKIHIYSPVLRELGEVS